MRLAVVNCLKYFVGEGQKAHAHLAGVRMKCQRTCQERELRAQRHRRRGPLPPALPEKYIQSISPFASMSSIQTPFDKTPRNGRLRDLSQEIFTKAKPKDSVIRSTWAAPTTKFKFKAIFIPKFREYISLKNSMLADNESKLLATPYFQDEHEDDREELLRKLPRYYEMKHDENGLFNTRLEQCRFYKDSIDAFLRKVGIAWDDVLFWLLAPDRMIKLINDGSSEGNQFESLLLNRSNYGIEMFERDKVDQQANLFQRDDGKWQDFLSQRTEPSARKLRQSATACAAVLKECNFSIWYLAQQSETFLKYVSKKTRDPAAVSTFTYRGAMCRVCHQHHCLVHGELREVPQDYWPNENSAQSSATRKHREDYSDYQGNPSRHTSRFSDYDDEEPDEEEEDEEEDQDPGDLWPAHLDDDSDVEKIINYKLPANPNAFDAYTESEMIESRGSIPSDGKFDKVWWSDNSYTMQWEKRKPFFPCSHEGSCEQVQCRCYRESINCEKTCQCSQSCKRRFPGCSCTSTPGKRICISQDCLCIAFNRECDADLCGSCGSAEILDPVNRYDESLLGGRCCDVAIQRGVPKKTLLGHSEVHGFGLYMGEDVGEGEYIGEYLGETISREETVRREAIYEAEKTMYLFDLNLKQTIDGTCMSNKTRFTNNAPKGLTNCEAKNLLCNTVFRLGLYATKDIKAGTELYFHYNYSTEATRDFKQPKGTVVAVKHTAKPTKRKANGKSSDSLYQSSRAKKRTAKIAEKAFQDPTNSRLSWSQNALKTAPSERSSRHQHLRVSQRHGRVGRTTRRSSAAHMEGGESNHDVASAESHEPQATTSTQEVQATDEDNEGTAIEESGNDMIRRTRGKARKTPSSTVVAVEGGRPGSSRKRKRPVVFNSDDG
ncbi:uncharacterized protein K460DRAFT_379824 [Cucurbitaria berberidis CBS 394.84]|uniref:SET domain-containing protein n=1 Tax=Cucurbitaria berberidis CBS 394.84 TaxID=1168544 RepID=A0A9P4GA61_9PLEO|nr:uncharacterized protein K460DRAFT_379824 [Cucurbitaria berberidis CBS 394.84]KAF1841831.1 hypothetical protein K460DRAFT_379824 [Cucurbitaria berberidis CBS 394.84]